MGTTDKQLRQPFGRLPAKNTGCRKRVNGGGVGAVFMLAASLHPRLLLAAVHSSAIVFALPQQPRQGTIDPCLRLRGGGKFPLRRMMKVTLDRMPPEERARMFDSLHQTMPTLDRDDDKYTRELQTFRKRWALEEAEAQGEVEAAERAKRQKREARVARLAAAPRAPAKLPPLSGDAGRIARTLEPYALGELGPVKSADCVSALLRLRSLPSAEGSSSVAARRACKRVSGLLLRHVATAVATCPDLTTFTTVLPMAADALWPSQLSPARAGHFCAPRGALHDPSHDADEACVQVVTAVLHRLSIRPKISALSREALEHVSRAAAVGAMYHCRPKANLSLSSLADVGGSTGGDIDCGEGSGGGSWRVGEALKTLAPLALRVPCAALSLPAIEALLLLCTYSQPDSPASNVSNTTGNCSGQSSGGGGGSSNKDTGGIGSGVGQLPSRMLLHLLAAAETHVSVPSGQGGRVEAREAGADTHTTEREADTHARARTHADTAYTSAHTQTHTHMDSDRMQLERYASILDILTHLARGIAPSIMSHVTNMHESWHPCE